MSCSASLVRSSLVLVLLTAGGGCDPSALRIPPADGATGGAPGPTDGGGAEAAREAPSSCPAVATTTSGPTDDGQVCTDVSSCRREPGELALCEASTEQDVQAKVSRCHRLFRGKAGDACQITVTRGGKVQFTTTGGLPFPASTAFCALRDGLECHLFQHECVPVPKLGEECVGRPNCAPGSFCDQVMCKPALALGELCQNVLDFIDQPQCVPGARCAGPSGSTCVPALTADAHCEFDGECVSGVCTHGACAPVGACPGPT